MEGPGEGKNTRKIALAGAGFLALVVLGLVLAGGMYYFARWRSTVPGEGPGLYTEVGKGPAGPVLESDPHRELAALRAREDSLLTGYGWVNRDSAVVRIPVARAMKIIVGRGLPVRTPADTIVDERNMR